MSNQDFKSRSQLQRAFSQVKKNKLAMMSFYIIIIFYAASALADFISPYSYNNEDRDYSYCPPTKIQFKNYRNENIIKKEFLVIYNLMKMR